MLKKIIKKIMFWKVEEVKKIVEIKEVWETFYFPEDKIKKLYFHYSKDDVENSALSRYELWSFIFETLPINNKRYCKLKVNNIMEPSVEAQVVMERLGGKK